MTMHMNGSRTGLEVQLLAERLRHEERLLIQAFAAAGQTATLASPENQALDLDAPAMDGRVVVSRVPASLASATLAALLVDAGALVVNGPELTALLADRVFALRRLRAVGLATVAATFATGEEGMLAAIRRHGYPALLAPLDATASGALIHDRESAEAIVEHRVVLGGLQAALVRPAFTEQAVRRLIVAGDATFAATRQGWPSEHGTEWQPAEVTTADRELADKLRGALGSGAYEVEVLDGDEPVLLEIGTLGTFREFHAVGYDVAGAIVRLTQAQRVAVGNA
jgi:[lysine-biosynthesis-protein LysW]--L-2-aminoadipate ligase